MRSQPQATIYGIYHSCSPANCTSYRLMWATVIVNKSTKAATNTAAGFTRLAQNFLWYWKSFKCSFNITWQLHQYATHTSEHAVVSAVLTKTACLSSRNLYCFEIDHQNTSLSLRFLWFASLYYNYSFLHPIYVANHLCSLINVLTLSEFVHKFNFSLLHISKFKKRQQNTKANQTKNPRIMPKGS